MSLDPSDLLLRVTSIEVVDAGDRNIGTSSLLVLLLLDIVVGAVGGKIGVVPSSSSNDVYMINRKFFCVVFFLFFERLCLLVRNFLVFFVDDKNGEQRT